MGASEKKSVSILGCGWFGLPLAEHLARSGYEVRGSTTDPAKTGAIEAAGAEPSVIKIEPDTEPGAERFFGSSVVVVNFPPERREDIADYLTGQAKTLISALERGGAEFVIFISSTSVYANSGKVVTESDWEKGMPEKASGAALREMEKALARGGFDLTVLRFGGLIGYDRNPRRFLKKRAAARPDLPVNLIHRDDCVKITSEIIKRDIRGEVFNAVADSHPLRSEFYRAEAEKTGAAVPQLKKGGRGKIVSSEKLKRALNYEFIRFGDYTD